MPCLFLFVLCFLFKQAKYTETWKVLFGRVRPWARCLEFNASPQRFSHQPERKQLWWQMLLVLILAGLFAFRFPRQSVLQSVSFDRFPQVFKGVNKPPPPLPHMHCICFLSLLNKHTDKGHPHTMRTPHAQEASFWTWTVACGERAFFIFSLGCFVFW